MPWVVGIDEAGYGPNLGPLVQTAVGLRLPDDDPVGWDSLKDRVRRCREKADGRLLVDDSKKVYAGVNGFAKLEAGAVGGLGIHRPTVGELVTAVGLAGIAGRLAGESWYEPGEMLDAVSGQPFEAVHVAANLVPAPAFNAIVAGSGSKGTVLVGGLLELLADAVARVPADGELLVLCDKLGGRNAYAPLLSAAFPGGWVVTVREGPAESCYRIDGLGREITVAFRPKADGDSVSVALASMLAKYLRELCMRQFNRFWATHVPGLAPTAGYPVDAKRYYAAIEPAMARLGLAADAVWRCR